MGVSKGGKLMGGNSVRRQPCLGVVLIALRGRDEDGRPPRQHPPSRGLGGLVVIRYLLFEGLTLRAWSGWRARCVSSLRDIPRRRLKERGAAAITAIVAGPHCRRRTA